MEEIEVFDDLSESKPLKIEILRGLIAEKMSTAVREILAVVETAVAGYENEVVVLNRELDRQKRQLDAILQPRVNINRTDFDVGSPDMSSISKVENEIRSVQILKIGDTGALEKCAQENVVASKVSHEEATLEHEELIWTLADLPSDSSVSCQANRKDSRQDDTINEVQNTKPTRRKRLPRRYRSNPNLTDNDSDDNDTERNGANEWKSSQSKRRRSSNVKKKHQIQLLVGLLENSPEKRENNNVFRPKSPDQTILCQQNLSEFDFLNQLRCTFPELRQDKSFEAFLVVGNKRSEHHLGKGITQAELYRAFRSHLQKQFAFYVQLTEPKDTCDTNTPTAACDKRPTTSVLEEEQLSDTEGPSKTTVEHENSMDSVAWSEDCEDDWKPVKNNEVEEHCAAPKKKNRTKRREKELSSEDPDTCKVCGYLFKSKTILTKHALSHLDHPKGICGVCGQHLESSEELKSHLETHQKLHQCDTCGRIFLTFVAFQRHIVKCQDVESASANEILLKKNNYDHKDKPYKCDNCPQSYSFKTQLEVHYRKHTGEKPYCCDVCGKSVTDYRGLCRHKLIHTGEKNYSCKQCGKLFYCTYFLKRHQKIHSDRERNYLCDICCKTFHTKQELKSHQKIHGETLYIKCPVCDKLLKGNLEKHMMVHTGEKPYSCKVCSKKFRSSSHLKKHMDSHLGVKPFTCTVCGYTCGRKEHLNVHMSTHTGLKPYKCKRCDKAFTQSHCLKTHMKSHQTEEQSATGSLLENNE